MFLRDFALPVLQADAVYQSSCFLGSALARYLIAQELVSWPARKAATPWPTGAASKGNDQVRMETAIAAQDPKLDVAGPGPRMEPEEPAGQAQLRPPPPAADRGAHGRPGGVIDRNLWGVSLYLHDLIDAWQAAAGGRLRHDPIRRRSAPMSRPMMTIGFEEGRALFARRHQPGTAAAGPELNRLGGCTASAAATWWRTECFGIKSRELYETPAPSCCWRPTAIWKAWCRAGS